MIYIATQALWFYITYYTDWNGGSGGGDNYNCQTPVYGMPCPDPGAFDES